MDENNFERDDEIISSFEMRDQIAQRADKGVGFFCGIPRLDELLEGFVGGELVTISGKTGCGKTLLAQTITSFCSQRQLNTLWFSYELMPREFLKRFEFLPLFYMPKKIKDNALEWIEQKIVEAKSKHNIYAVFIDHLHFLVDLAQQQNSSLQIGQIVRKLKRMALEYEVVIFLLCHTEKIKAPIPTIDEIRDSSLIPAESDTVLIVWRDEDDDTISGVSVEKARRTGAWKKKTKLIKCNGLLVQKEDGK